MTINGAPQSYACQFEFDITTFFNPTEPVDAGIGGTTKQLNDVVVAFPPNTAGQLNVTSTPDAATTNAGAPIGVTIAVSNAGPGVEDNVALNDPLPAGAGVSWSISPAYSGPGTCSIAGAVGSQVLSCSFGNLAAGASASLHITSASAGAGTYVNAATVTVNNQQFLSIATITVAKVAPVFSGLTPSQSMSAGTASISLSGGAIRITRSAGNTMLTVVPILGAAIGGATNYFFIKGIGASLKRVVSARARRGGSEAL